MFFAYPHTLLENLLHSMFLTFSTELIKFIFSKFRLIMLKDLFFVAFHQHFHFPNAFLVTIQTSSQVINGLEVTPQVMIVVNYFQLTTLSFSVLIIQTNFLW